MTGPRIKLAPGIYQDPYGISVIAKVGTAPHQRVSPPIRFPLGTALPVLQARWHREKMRLKEAQQQHGGPTLRGTLAADVVRYLEVATLRPQRRQERTQQLRWWCRAAKLGHRVRSSLTALELRQALHRLDKTASTKNKYRTALSNLYTVLDGKNASNPFRDVPPFDEPEPERRDQPYELIDAILAHLRDRGQGTTLSKTKARLRVLAYAPVTRAQLLRMDRSDVHWATSEISTPGRQKGEGTRGQRKRLTDDGVAAFRAYDAAGCFGAPWSKSATRKLFLKARDAAIRELAQTRPDLDLTRAATMRVYDLRHSFATFAYQTTKSLSITGQLLDHRDPKTTLRYAQGAVPGHLKVAGDAIAAAMASRAPYVPRPEAGTLDLHPKLAPYSVDETPQSRLYLAKSVVGKSAAPAPKSTKVQRMSAKSLRK